MPDPFFVDPRFSPGSGRSRALGLDSLPVDIQKLVAKGLQESFRSRTRGLTPLPTSQGRIPQDIAQALGPENINLPGVDPRAFDPGAVQTFGLPGVDVTQPVLQQLFSELPAAAQNTLLSTAQLPQALGPAPQSLLPTDPSQALQGVIQNFDLSKPRRPPPDLTTRQNLLAALQGASIGALTAPGGRGGFGAGDINNLGGFLLSAGTGALTGVQAAKANRQALQAKAVSEQQQFFSKRSKLLQEAQKTLSDFEIKRNKIKFENDKLRFDVQQKRLDELKPKFQVTKDGSLLTTVVDPETRQVRVFATPVDETVQLLRAAKTFKAFADANRLSGTGEGGQQQKKKDFVEFAILGTKILEPTPRTEEEVAALGRILAAGRFIEQNIGSPKVQELLNKAAIIRAGTAANASALRASGLNQNDLAAILATAANLAVTEGMKPTNESQ